MGFLSQDKVIPILKKSRFIILPSIFEAMPMSLLEGMSCGCIPIATKVGYMHEIIDNNNGILIDNNKVESIKKVLRNINKMRNIKVLSMNCRRKMESDFSWREISDSYICAYK